MEPFLEVYKPYPKIDIPIHATSQIGDKLCDCGCRDTHFSSDKMLLDLFLTIEAKMRALLTPVLRYHLMICPNCRLSWACQIHHRVYRVYYRRWN